MQLGKVATAKPGPSTRFGGQPYFPGEPVWPLHPSLGVPLTFLCQILVPSAVAGDGTWLVHVFIDVSSRSWAEAVVIHPATEWSGPAERRRIGPTYAHEWPESELDRERFNLGPQFGFIIYDVDLIPGADPASWPSDGQWEAMQDDWNKVGGTPLTLQGGEEKFLAEGWRFLASFGADYVGHGMGDGAHCCVWIHPDGRGVLDVQGH